MGTSEGGGVGDVGTGGGGRKLRRLLKVSEDQERTAEGGRKQSRKYNVERSGRERQMKMAPL